MGSFGWDVMAIKSCSMNILIGNYSMNTCSLVCLVVNVLCIFQLGCSIDIDRKLIVSPVATVEKEKCAKRFLVKDGRSVIYIYRADSFNQDRSFIILDNEEIGFMFSMTYVMLEVGPGPHEITTKLEYWNSGSLEFVSRKNDECIIKVITEPNRIYFVQQESNPWAWGRKLISKVVSKKEGEGQISHLPYKLLDLPGNQYGNQDRSSAAPSLSPPAP